MGLRYMNEGVFYQCISPAALGLFAAFSASDFQCWTYFHDDFSHSKNRSHAINLIYKIRAAYHTNDVLPNQIQTY